MKPERINLDDLDDHSRSLFMTLMIAALKVHGIWNKDHWMSFCNCVWNTLELNGAENMQNVMKNLVNKDLSKFGIDPKNLRKKNN